MKTSIVVRLNVEGIHNWPEARNVFPEVGFLSDPHRHIFHIECKKQVTHDDRDIEIIMFKRDILDYLSVNYSTIIAAPTVHDFGSKSCEMLARELLMEFKLDYCQVLEDNENGAEIWK